MVIVKKKQKTNTFELMHIFIPILTSNSKTKVSYNQLIKELKEFFGLEVTKKDLDMYYEPTLSEEALDKRLLMNNLIGGYD